MPHKLQQKTYFIKKTIKIRLTLGDEIYSVLQNPFHGRSSNGAEQTWARHRSASVEECLTWRWNEPSLGLEGPGPIDKLQPSRKPRSQKVLMEPSDLDLKGLVKIRLCSGSYS